MKSPNLMTHGKTIAVLAVMLSLTAPAANAASGPFVLSDGQVERRRATWFGHGSKAASSRPM